MNHELVSFTEKRVKDSTTSDNGYRQTMTMFKALHGRSLIVIFSEGGKIRFINVMKYVPSPGKIYSQER